MKARIIASYRSCCFCDKAELQPGNVFDSEPRFNFAAAVKQYANERGLTKVNINKRSSGRGATAVLTIPCTHRTEQIVGLDWTIVW
jgi:hypothetical protein